MSNKDYSKSDMFLVQFAGIIYISIIIIFNIGILKGIIEMCDNITLLRLASIYILSAVTLYLDIFTAISCFKIVNLIKEVYRIKK